MKWFQSGSKVVPERGGWYQYRYQFQLVPAGTALVLTGSRATGSDSLPPFKGGAGTSCEAPPRSEARSGRKVPGTRNLSGVGWVTDLLFRTAHHPGGWGLSRPLLGGGVVMSYSAPSAFSDPFEPEFS